ncbi:lytic transglycosylase domain-containing protein [uncultured Gordonia sp.]|uniref:lytic transglycosylase domain-containing protein n=1 Tax=uncultured Gordonia sp. TaxID=198437 RepID=UPI00259287BB|nr:lytic transglycosylase domain-containing protein [uncultured Gordonia sp.]
MTTPTAPGRQHRRVYAALAALLALTALVTALLVLTHTGGNSTDATPVSAPGEFVEPLTEFGSACEGLTPTVLAAQIRVSSGFRAGAVSAAGAEGYAQMMPRTWARYGQGGDPNNPRDAVRALAELDCSLLATAHARGCLGEDATRAMLAMYNAGEAAVRGCAAPANGETDRYVARVLALR